MQTLLEERLLYFQQVLKALEQEGGLGREEEEEEEEEEGDRGEGGGERGGEDRGGFPTTHLAHALHTNVAEQGAIIDRMKTGLLTAASAYSRLTTHPPTSSSSSSSSAAEERALLSLLQVRVGGWVGGWVVCQNVPIGIIQPPSSSPTHPPTHPPTHRPASTA